QDQQLRAAQEENELQRHKLQEEVAGYREQSKQHSLTILALEDRLLEATQQQKVLEEEKAALQVLWPNPHPRVTPGDQKAGRCAWQWLRSALIFPRKLQEELAVAQGTLLEKKAIISRLTRELSETRARMSDMRGELSEEQKVELEHSQRQLKHREWEVNQLREKLSEMSSLVEEKDQALKAASEELRYTLTSPKASWMPLCPQQLLVLRVLPSAWQQGCVYIELQTGQEPVFFQEPTSGLAELGAKCRGLRHEETIQHQKEGLAELRERVKVLEKRQCSGAVKSNSVPLVVQMKDSPEKIVQQRGLELEPAPVMGEKLRVGKVGRQRVPNGGSFGITNSTEEMAEVRDLAEKMYLDVIGALGSLVEMKELSGMQPLQHLAQERGAEVGLQRQNTLELLYKKIRNLQVCLERKEERLKDYEGSVEQLRQSQASLRRCQEEMSRLEDEAHREAEEKALLQEALERMQLQQDQQKGLQQVAKGHKV
ncbi:FHAD1 protein, partial [Oenanthe oenanthe]|nr:FHAD1 protein [Oenanthe oenanthe]